MMLIQIATAALIVSALVQDRTRPRKHETALGMGSIGRTVRLAAFTQQDFTGPIFAHGTLFGRKLRAVSSSSALGCSVLLGSMQHCAHFPQRAPYFVPRFATGPICAEARSLSAHEFLNGPRGRYASKRVPFC
jgi:hypothetical protein